MTGLGLIFGFLSGYLIQQKTNKKTKGHVELQGKVRPLFKNISFCLLLFVSPFSFCIEPSDYFIYLSGQYQVSSSIINAQIDIPTNVRKRVHSPMWIPYAAEVGPANYRQDPTTAWVSQLVAESYQSDPTYQGCGYRYIPSPNGMSWAPLRGVPTGCGTQITPSDCPKGKGTHHFHVIYAGNSRLLRCPKGQVPLTNEIDAKCGLLQCSSPYNLSTETLQCEAYCTTGESWDPATERCVPPPEEQNCKTQGKFPIDFIEGRKYRSEPVLSAGVRYPFSLTYYFSNHRNQEKSPVGSKVAVVTGDRYLAATKPPITTSEYQAVYTNRGVPKGSTVYREGQHYGSVDQYWRHNFDEVLLVQGSQYLYQSSRGEEIVFNGFGSSTTYPSLVLEALASGEEASSGYKLTNRLSREVRKFDQNGRLIKLERSPKDVLTLTYDSQSRLERITNSEGAYIQLTYQSLVTDSIYSITSTSHSFPISVTNNRGESAQITWGKSYQGKSAKFHLITQITETNSGAAQSARTFEYNDTRWPASITDQYFVADISNSTNKQQTLHFEYDDLGRAIFSGLNGRPSDTVTYVDANTRVVTNVLGKQATYTFADFDGVKRLQNVTGEPTQNCVSSEVAYEYDANGNVSRKTQNGQVTEYLYDAQNREISRAEAADTQEVRTITTEYHPTLNLPARIEEPGMVEIMDYDSEGRLLSSQKMSTSR